MQMLHLVAALLLLHLRTVALALNQEGLDLIQAKLGLEDPNNALANWNSSDSTPCKWTGITCATISGTGGNPSVINLDLNALDLAGPFPAAICRLPNLSVVNLSLNYINSTLLNSSLLPCRSLTHLDLSQNLLVGSLPDSLASLSLLRYLDVSANNFTGAIPVSFALFPSLQILSLTANLLNETIPAFLGNISTLQELNLAYNPFAPGLIPSSLANLSNIETIWLAGCGLIGSIPSTLGRLKKLTNLDLSSNFLTGNIPDTFPGLASVVQIELYNNTLSGNLPLGLSNLTALRRFDAAMNLLSGSIPDDVFSIPLLESLHLYQNSFAGYLPVTAGKAGKLLELRVFSNNISGSLPADLGTNSPLMFLDLSENLLTGEISKGICDGGKLQEILLINNYLSGSLPEGLGHCRSLSRVRLANNRLSGVVPAGMWGLPHVWILELTDNSFSGEIPSNIAGATNLSKLLIARNQFSGNIPAEIGSLSKLYEFSASDNRLTGPLPVSLGSLPELGQLDLHNNSLSGELLTGIKSWGKLTKLNLADNDFTGRIPLELGNLPVLNYLDLSGNVLSGEIPMQLQNLKLNQFNLSNNQLSGPIPPMFHNDAYRSSFLDNPGLCRDFNGLCPSSAGNSHGRSKFFWLLRAIFIFAALVLIVGITLFYWKYWNIKRGKKMMDKSKWILTSFHKLGFSEYEILDSLDEDNVIGSGASGKVYKLVLSNNEALAVKKLWKSNSLKNDGANHHEAAYDAFESEVATLGKIRHKNIVKLWCSCSHRDCKLLVYEYMPNGSLGDLLHSSKASLLDWPTRFKIALDAAEGLCYLHHDCVPPIVHRDVKSNNILLDGDFGAKVSDFGVAKVVDAIGKGPQSMSVIAGSCGYIAPEYAYTLRVNEKSDIYSFGVVILELITGKPPVGPEFGEKDLVKWVCSNIQQNGEDSVIDSKLDISSKAEISKVLHIGLHCTSNLPINRPSMRRVVKMLVEVREESKPSLLPKDGKLSPYYHDEDEGNIA
ncbi:receptor-like protein kinase HSL1 [Dendrobium catenatum]|uniref:non-specific serine/threonine protein kinase n=1 Tax=Dendrobium catenatum TaxID=906689 RepID=A0A2I0W5Z0_9ASPA|nr:receptor-like protein kinase HSL1 [Dendrobium catenatum]PKU71079.1 Receptor-like protein kinase HSL1 [Dendrobium catenatum]